MRGTIWAWISAAIGLIVVIVLIVYGTQYGTWADEVGPLPVSPPSLLLPFLIGGLAVVLLIGGAVVGSWGRRRR